MRRLCFLLTLFCCLNSVAQDFNLEYKAYLLQPYFKEWQIKSLTIQKSEDSLFKNKTIQYQLEFDKLGRLIKVFDYYFDSDTIPERMIAYSYDGESIYYNTKVYHYLNDEIFSFLKKSWILSFDSENNILTEKFQNKKEDYRVNSLVFNKAMQLMSRTVEVYVIKLRTKFSYDGDGLLKQVQLIKENPTSKKSKRLELNHYLQYNRYQKILTTEQWVGERDKQVSEYYYNYIGQNISAKVGWSLMNWSNDDKKLIERTNFTYDHNGLIIKSDYFNEKRVSERHIYTGFEYTFFSNRTQLNGRSDEFTMLWFTDIFAENLIHP